MRSLVGLSLVVCSCVALGAEPVEVYARGDYAGVVALLEPPHKEGKAKIQERLLLARAYVHLSRQADALAVLRAVLDADKENPEANALTGQLLLKAGKHKEAIEPLEHAYRLRQDPATAADLGLCHHALGQDTKAKAYLEKALEHDVRNPSNSFILGRICLNRGLGALAERYLLMAQDAGMDSPELHLLLGRAYLAQRKLAGPVLVRRIAGSPKPGEVVDGHLVLDAVAGAADQFKVATRFCALYEGLWLLKANPNNAEALHMAASSWLDAGQAGLAEKRLAELLKQEPDSPRAADLQARVLLAARRFDALEACLEGGLAKKEFTARAVADFYYRAANDRRAEGKRDDALRLLKKAETHAPASAEILQALAGLHAAAGRRDEARRCYARMVELFPDAPDADEWRNAINLFEQKGGAQQ
ncbi:MAG: tetratricopeptide repeat protein [Planctomycetes bacterium]|nr:tetratricopeptide repeat protein [Planctomycetota bacterium]